METALLFITGLAMFAAQFVVSFMLSIWGAAVCVGACIFAVHLYMVQPVPERSERGWTAQYTALTMSVPLFIAGFAGLCFIWSRP